MKSVKRSDYLHLLWSGKDDNDVIKVIVGMRRSGKSTLLDQYIEMLLESGVDRSSIFKLDFDTIEGQKIKDKDALNGWISDNVPQDRQIYVLLDEIQNVVDWEMSVAALQTMKLCDVYITGSNSKMLSSEISTKLSGRYIEIKVQPFSFREYLEMYPCEDVGKRFDEYLLYGGLPITDPDKDPAFIDGLLEGVYNTVLVKDILARLRTDDVSKITAITKFLYSNIGNLTSIDSIAKATGISNVTVSKYVDEMLKAYLFYYAERYDIVGKKILKTNGKYYASDLGLRSASLGASKGRDISKPLENVVYMELLRRGYKVSVGSFKDYEIDFTAKRSDTVEYFQVCETLKSQETLEREMRPYRGIKDNYTKTILTMDRTGLGQEDGIEVRNVIDWLLGTD
jgi:hypothetical protein